MTALARVVVTGLGVKTPAGNDLDALWSSLLEAAPTARTLTGPGDFDHEANFGCRVPDFPLGPYATPREAGRLDRASVFGLAAAGDAISHAGGLKAAPERRAVVVGSGHGGVISMERGFGNPRPLHVPMTMHNASAAWISMRHQILGPSFCVSTACASGGHAVGEGYRLIRERSADVVVAGGNEAGLTPTNLLAFKRIGALSGRHHDPARASRPFDTERDGFVMGEGAAFLVLEELHAARERGATVLAELLGYGRTSDAHHISAPSPGAEGAIRAIHAALDDAGLTPQEVAHVNAHGTSTPLNDITEALAIGKVFGPYQVPVTAPKGVTGHLIRAAGALEAVISVLTLRHRTIPPIANLGELDGRCEVDAVTGAPRPLGPGAVISNSFGFGGHNTTLVFGPPPI